MRRSAMKSLGDGGDVRGRGGGGGGGGGAVEETEGEMQPRPWYGLLHQTLCCCSSQPKTITPTEQPDPDKNKLYKKH